MKTVLTVIIVTLSIGLATAQLRHPMNGTYNGAYDSDAYIRDMGIRPQDAWCGYLASIAERANFRRLFVLKGIVAAGRDFALEEQRYIARFGEPPCNAEASWIRHMIAFEYTRAPATPRLTTRRTVLDWCYTRFPDPLFAETAER